MVMLAFKFLQLQTYYCEYKFIQKDVLETVNVSASESQIYYCLHIESYTKRHSVSFLPSITCYFELTCTVFFT